jgi:hypothetical protein
VFADEAAAMLRRTGRKLHEVALGRLRVRPQDFGERKAARSHLPFNLKTAVENGA